MGTSCTDVCDDVIAKLLSARLPVSTEDEESHDDVLQALANSILIPLHFHVPDNAHYRDAALSADLQIDMEEMIAGIIFDFEISQSKTQLGEDDCAELGRQIFRAISARLRPDFFHSVEIELA